MKKQNLLAALLFLTASVSIAATQVPSSINGNTVWDRAGNPYVISGRVVVPAGTILKIGPGVQVYFKGAASLEVNGSLQVVGAAAAPAVFNMTEGGTQSEIFINGGEARVGHAKFLGGLFLAKDSQISLKGSEVTKGGGVYLQGSTKASMKGNKIYGNAAGIVLDGGVVASIQFNTMVQNTYGLYLKSYSNLTFRNNSVHGNQKEVVNLGATAPLGGNFWGTNDAASLAAKVQGSVDTLPLKGLKDVLRAYIRTELPVITQEMSDKRNAKERKEAKEKALALKKLRKAQDEPKIVRTPPAGEAAPELAQEASPAPAEEQAEAQAPAPEPVEEAKVAPEPPSMSQEKPKTVKVTPLPPAPQKLKTLANLPPDIGDVDQIKSAPLPGGSSAFEASAPSTTSPASSGLPPMDDLSPPDLESVQPPPAAPAEPPAVSSPATSPSTTDSGDIPIPSDTEASVSTAAALPAVTATAPEPPAAPAAESAPEVPPSLGEPTDKETAAAKKLSEDVPVGDIDGMQAPPLDLFGDLSTIPLDDTTVGKTKAKPTSPADSDVTLPPLQDSDIEPPKDLDLPPTDDLGNFNLDSKQ